MFNWLFKRLGYITLTSYQELQIDWSKWKARATAVDGNLKVLKYDSIKKDQEIKKLRNENHNNARGYSRYKTRNIRTRTFIKDNVAVNDEGKVISKMFAVDVRKILDILDGVQNREGQKKNVKKKN